MLTMTISGEAAPAVASFPVENPATSAVCGVAPECSAEQLNDAMGAAGVAFDKWRATSRGQRRAVLEKLAAVVEQHANELADLITTEQGKPLAEASDELEDAVSALRYFAALELPTEVLLDDARTTVRVVRRPVGPVAAITPWNFPLGMAVAKVAPALAAGCTMVLKPSPFTPLSCLRFGELTRDVLPAGVLNVISGPDELGARMTTHPVARMVSFTGSVATGKQVAMAAAPDLKRLTLELGGNDPAIVLDDVDVSRVAEELLASAFYNCGQVCDAIKRVYVPERLHDQLVEALGVRALAMKVGPGHEEGTKLGPLSNQMQFDRVSGLVRDAVDRGAQVVTGGRPVEGPGYFFQPTVFARVEDGFNIVDEEQFGPVLPIVAYRDVRAALDHANATHFGLGASVWTSDPDRGAELASAIESGTVWVNTHGAAVRGQPSGGVKWSGIGVEGGRWGLIGFTDLQVLHFART